MLISKQASRSLLLAAVATFGLPFLPASKSEATTIVRVTLENLAPSQGTVITPLWVGFHDGTFALFALGQSASPSLERLAEDGATGGLANDFSSIGAGLVEGTLLGVGLGVGTPPVIPPGTLSTGQFTLDETLPSSRYFSYAGMVVPSNDAFIANGNPLAFKIIDENGNFLGADFIVSGNLVWDAGTEVNDEIPANTALLEQTTPNTGVAENGVVTLHPGFLPNGNILNAFPSANFKTQDYQVARIRVEQVQVPESTSIIGILGIGGLILSLRPFRKG